MACDSRLDWITRDIEELCAEFGARCLHVELAQQVHGSFL